MTRNRIMVMGVDPGLVNTGVVITQFDTKAKTIYVEVFAIEGDDHAFQVEALLKALAYKPDHMFVEEYRERGTSYGTNTPMRKLLQEFRARFPKAKIIDNTGVKKIVRAPVLKILGIHKFQTTHHQDLESAARILVYGMLKDTELNALLFQVVDDYVAGRPWPVMK